MSKVGKQIIEGLDDALAYLKGDKSRGREIVIRVPDDVDVAAIRVRTGLTQAEFATKFGFNKRTLQDWEQGRRRPEGPARVLLTLIEKEPKAVFRALGVRAA
ncbi:MAG: helix-turn-helix domain-containing protein [Candidatus Methylomirabilis sp.]|nr:helix-turn-helix domain-containing protein [Deltaproteobacteria bacterium]